MSLTESKPTFPLIFTICLGFFLMVPLLLRTAIPGLEPYPAIMLPAGSSKVDLSQDTVKFIKIEILGEDQNGDWVEVDPNYLLDPIPIHYLYVVSEEDLGLKLGERKEVKSRIFGFSIPKRQYSEEEITAAKAWISEKLTYINLSGDHFRIRTVNSNLDLETYNVDPENFENDRIIDLR